MRHLRFALGLAAAFMIAAIAATTAQQFGTGTVFVTGKGDITFPFAPPTAAGATPGTINNMVIGGTTPQAGTFTTVTAAAISGAATVDSVCASFVAPIAADAVDSAFFIAPKALTVTSARAVWGVIAGAAFTAMPKKATGTQAPSAGASLLTAAFDINTTANTVATGTLTATGADLVLAAGNRLAIDFTGSATNTAGLAITLCMQ